MTNCGRCGLLNRDDLRFCADCGTRLDKPFASAPAASPAPPPAAPPPSVPRPAPAVAPSGPGTSRVPRPQPRPVAPAFDLSPAELGRACPHCNASNDPEARFCTSCGSGLDGSPQRATPPPRDDTVTCGRCHGTNQRGLPYCQFCGARLAEGPVQPAARPPQAAWQDPSAGQPSARLVVIAQDGTPGTEYPLAGPESDVGREDGSIRLPTDPYVSPRHLRISQRNDRFFVRDLESVNGVYVRLRAAEVLRHADLVLIGLEVLRFELVSDAERGLGPATERGTRVFGSPSVPRLAKLCQLTVEGVTRDQYYLSRDETVIGRESGDVVFTNDPFMSRRHASVDRDVASGSFTLRDLGSSNGTFIAIRGERELMSGDHLRVGQHLFRLDVTRGRG
jgi:pSer/pThr/pTyr-binding forkhead associated (FHA) protein